MTQRACGDSTLGLPYVADGRKRLIRLINRLRYCFEKRNGLLRYTLTVQSEVVP
jgi:hypothetical protein